MLLVCVIGYVYAQESSACPDYINGTVFVPLTYTNGACHDVQNPFEGLSLQIHIRTEKPQYVDGLGTPMGFDRPSPREISNLVHRQPPGLPSNIKGSSRLLIFFGQFIDHDFALVSEQPEVEGVGELLDIEVPRSDTRFNAPLAFGRSEFLLDQSGVRQFVNNLTPYLDLGNVYGDTLNRTARLRSSTGGALLVDPTLFQALQTEFPPFIDPLPNGNFAPLCGDIRCGENTQLFAWHTLWLRNHNYWARRTQAAMTLDPVLDNDLIFNVARVKNIIEYQALVWGQYLPYLLGRINFFALTGNYVFNTGVDPTVSLVFSTAAFRYGHSGVPNDLVFLDESRNPVRPTLPLVNAFMMPRLVVTNPNGGLTDYVGNMFLGQGSISHDILDSRIVDALRDNLFANVPAFAPGSDLPARNIQRARDHGLATINTYRASVGLQPYVCPENPLECFEQITTNSEISEALFELYGDISECEIFPCGMAEDSYRDSLLGETFTFLLAESFQRIRSADRLWYQNEEVVEGFTGLNPTFPPGVGFPIGLSSVVDRNVNQDQQTEPRGNLFVTQTVWLAFAAPDEFIIEWFLPRGIAAPMYQITVNMGGNVRTIMQGGSELLATRVSEGVSPGMRITVSVAAATAPGATTPIGEVTFTTPGGPAPRTTYTPGAIAGIIIACIVGLVLLLGFGLCLSKRSGRYNKYKQETFL